MLRRELDANEVEELLCTQRIVRVAFSAEPAPYLIPLGYVYFAGSLWGATAPGRKTELAQTTSRVTFQVDSSAETGIYRWQSVVGVGVMSLVVDEPQRGAVFAALRPLIDAAPSWWRSEHERSGLDGLEVWRIAPETMTGRTCDPPEDT